MTQMEITPRLKQILLVLLGEEQPISVNKLAQEIGVSKRTVQRELEYMDHTLKKCPVQFLSRTGVGVWLEGSREEKQKLREQLESEETYDAANREERRKRLILEILKDKGLKKLFYYSSQFGVSEATISSDLEAVENWLNTYGLKVVRKPGSGVVIEGNEENYRQAIRVFIDENMDTRMVRESYEMDEGYESRFQALKNKNISQVLNDDILNRVIKCIMSMNDSRVLNLTENSYVGLVLHISIAINRILKNEIMEQDSEWIAQQEQDADYQLAEVMVKQLEQEFEIEIPPIEISYICLHIKGAKHSKVEWSSQKSLEIEKKEILQLINELINAYDEEKAFELKQDDEFIQGLLAHLQPTLVRLSYHMQIKNPVLEDIKAEYPEVFERSRKVGKVLEEWVHRPVPESEIGFLAIHFGAAMVRLEGKRENVRKVAVGVVCASGIGISRLMLSKIEKNFKDRVQLTAYGKKDVTPYVMGKTDFFVSSIPLDIPKEQVIQVNPLLNEEDMEQIRSAVYHYERLPSKNAEETKFSMELDQVNLVAMQIKTIIQYMELYKVSNDISFEELLVVIGEKLSPYRDRSQIIQEDIRKRERMGTQIFSEFGFALLHTRTQGVIRPGFTVWRTRDQKAFTDSYFKGINVVLVMLLPVDEHIRINSDILGFISSTLIEEYDFLDIILNGEKEEIRSTLSDYLRKYFAQYLNKLQ